MTVSIPRCCLLIELTSLQSSQRMFLQPAAPNTWMLTSSCVHRLNDPIPMPCPMAEGLDLGRGTAAANWPTGATQPVRPCRLPRDHCPFNMDIQLHKVSCLRSCTVPLAQTSPA